jgi:hypothetical protein
MATTPTAIPLTPGTLDGGPLPEDTARQLESLQQRVHQLEDAVATLQDTRQLEDHLVGRVAERLARTPAHHGNNTAGIIIEAGRHLLPAALEAVRTPEPPPEPGAAARPAWLLVELYTELRAIYWMFLDPRYRLTWTARLVTPIILFFMFSFWFFFDARLLFVGTLLDKVVDALLVVVLYKVLVREARRYRTAYPLPPVRRSL